MEVDSFLTSVGTSFIIFVVLMLLFTWLSRKPGNKEIYYPKLILKGVDPLVAHRSPFAWITEALSSSEKDIIECSGVDTAVYFVFLNTALGILVFSGVLLVPVLLSIAVTDNGLKTLTNQTGSNEKMILTYNTFDMLSIENVKPKSPRYWTFLIGTYSISIIAYYMLWKAYNHIIELRTKALQSPEVREEQFAVLVRDIPPPSNGQTRKQQVDSYFKSIYPDTFYRSIIVTDNREVNKIWKELNGYRKKLARSEAVFARSKTTDKPEGTRPTKKPGRFLTRLAICKKVDNIDYYNNKIKELVPQLEAMQKATLALREKQQAAALVFFTSRVSAASAAQSVHATRVNTWTVTNAPEPRQLIWANLHIRFFERKVRQYVVYVIAAVIIFLSLIPIAIISAVMNLVTDQGKILSLTNFLLRALADTNMKIILVAYLPLIAFVVLFALMSKLLMFISKKEGIHSQSDIERAASVKYFYFSVLNVFTGVTVGTICNLYHEVEKIKYEEYDHSVLIINPFGSSTFYLIYLALEYFFINYGLEMSRIVPLIIFHIKKKYWCNTDAEIKEAWAPGDLGYLTRVPGDMLILTIVFFFSIFVPLIILFGVIYFALGWLILRNQVLKVYVPSYESYGRIWPHIHTRILATLILFQATTLGYLALNYFVYTVLLIPGIIFSFIFGYVCHKKFYKSFGHTPLDVTAKVLKDTPDMERIFRAYIPPSLSSNDKINDEHSEDPLSQVSGSTSIV